MQHDHFQKRKKNKTFWPHPRGRGCVLWQHICFHGAPFSIPFNFDKQQDYFQKKVMVWHLTPSWGQGCVCRQNICYHNTACVVSFNLMCNMTIFWKRLILASVPPPKSTLGVGTQAFKLKSPLICFISIVPLPACEISANILTTA